MQAKFKSLFLNFVFFHAKFVPKIGFYGQAKYFFL